MGRAARGALQRSFGKHARYHLPGVGRANHADSATHQGWCIRLPRRSMQRDGLCVDRDELRLSLIHILRSVADHKVKRESDVAGNANILIFPNLHAGNIGVKLVQIFGHANAYGPVLQGFAKPVCDFSRSAPVEEMLGNVAMLVIRAAAQVEGE